MRKKYILEIIMVAGLFLIDQVTKFLVASNMYLGQEIEIIKNFFSLTYVRNTGAGFSILEGKMTFFYIITIFALCFLGYLLIKGQKEHPLYITSILFMIGGTLGNFFDRIVYQYVIDFLDFIIFGFDFAVFNMADVFLTVGVMLFIVEYFLETKGVIHGKN